MLKGRSILGVLSHSRLGAWWYLDTGVIERPFILYWRVPHRCFHKKKAYFFNFPCKIAALFAN